MDKTHKERVENRSIQIDEADFRLREICESKLQEIIDGLVYEVVRMADQYHLNLPVYSKIAGELKKNVI
jgi:hypothetical protein